MSERIFQAMDEVASQGLDAMLKEIVRTGSDEHDYSKVCQAKYHLKRLELGLPEIVDSGKDIEDRKDSLQPLNDVMRQCRAEVAAHYKADGIFLEAALNFIEAGRPKDAIDMFIKEGSERSLADAAFWAVESGVDYKFGFDYRIQKGEIRTAFDELHRVSDSHGIGTEEKQRWGEYLTRAAYHAVVDGIKAEIEEQEGQKPKGETISQLLDGRDAKLIFVSDGHIDKNFVNSLRYVSESSDPEIIQLGIELYAFLVRHEEEKHMKEYYEITEMYLKGKLTGSDEYIQYLIKKTEENQTNDELDFGKFIAERAVDVLQFHKKYDAALKVAERFLSPEHKTRFALLEKLGDTQKLALAYRDIDDPISYAMVVSGRTGQ
ncbi:MAG: hypothetical protein GXP63_00610 [DPANN group archaeon]|nr:hypothetical protein [DPANN group archaeon]